MKIFSKIFSPAQKMKKISLELKNFFKENEKNLTGNEKNLTQNEKNLTIYILIYIGYCKNLQGFCQFLIWVLSISDVG